MPGDQPKRQKLEFSRDRDDCKQSPRGNHNRFAVGDSEFMSVSRLFRLRGCVDAFVKKMPPRRQKTAPRGFFRWSYPIPVDQDVRRDLGTPRIESAIV